MRAHDLQRGPKQAERKTAPRASLTFVITAASSRLEKGKKKIQIKKPGGPGLAAGGKRRVVRVEVLALSAPRTAAATAAAPRPRAACTPSSCGAAAGPACAGRRALAPRGEMS